MKTLLLTCVFAFMFNATTFAQCDTTNTAFENLVQKYEQQYKAIEPDTTNGKPWSKSVLATLDLDVDVKMVDKRMIFDLISVTMKNKDISFNTPQVTMQNKKSIITNYEPGLLRCVVGYKPVFRWPKVKMEAIYGKCPSMVKKTIEVVTKIPVFTYATTGFITKVPEFRKDRKEVLMKLPQVTVKRISSQVKALQSDADKLQEKFAGINAEAQKEMSFEIVKTFDCQKNAILLTRDSVQRHFNTSIEEVDKSIALAKANGIDPGKVVADDGSVTDINALREDLLNQLSLALKSFDDSLAQLVENERGILSEFAGQVNSPAIANQP